MLPVSGKNVDGCAELKETGDFLHSLFGSCQPGIQSCRNDSLLQSPSNGPLVRKPVDFSKRGQHFPTRHLLLVASCTCYEHSASEMYRVDCTSGLFQTCLHAISDSIESIIVFSVGQFSQPMPTPIARSVLAISSRLSSPGQSRSE